MLFLSEKIRKIYQFIQIQDSPKALRSVPLKVLINPLN